MAQLKLTKSAVDTAQSKRKTGHKSTQNVVAGRPAARDPADQTT